MTHQLSKNAENGADWTPPDRLVRDLMHCGLVGKLHRSADGIEAKPGAYLLLLGLAEPRQIGLRGRVGGKLKVGWYVYCGSAKGPGGMKARLGRHFRPDKQQRWHVDILTDELAMVAALPQADGAECDLVDCLLSSSTFEVAIAGFGSSDCRRCISHLLRWQGS